MLLGTARFRDEIRKWIPPWLSDRRQSGLTYGFRFLWVMISVLDAAVEMLVQGLSAAWPGVGTYTALPLIGRTRGILRGEAETDASFSSRLIAWLDTWRGAGSALTLAKQIQAYLGNTPRVRIVNRAGFWITLDSDGTVTTAQQAFNWDGTSHPERSGFWSEMWIIIYPTQWALTGNWGDGRTWGQPEGLGHANNRVEYDAVNNLIAQWKAAHTKVRSVIWTSDSTLFDPTDPGTLPDGTWGAWGGTGSGSRVISGRNYSTCRYWEPR